MWVVLFVGELGGLVFAVVEGSRSGGAVAFTLLVYTVLAGLLGEMPLIGRTSQARRRKTASDALGIPLRIYTQEQYKMGAIEAPPFIALNGYHLGLPNVFDEITPEELAKHVVGFIYAVVPHEFTMEALHGLARRFMYASGSVEAWYEKRLYEAILDCYREVMAEIGPPL